MTGKRKKTMDILLRIFFSYCLVDRFIVHSFTLDAYSRICPHIIHLSPEPIFELPCDSHDATSGHLGKIEQDLYL